MQSTTPPGDRPRVVDAHAHILPYLGGPAGFASAEEHLLYVQRAMHTHGAQPARRLRDHAVVDRPTLWNPNDPSPEGRRDVGFRAGDNGRFEWRDGDEEIYLQFMPPSLQTMEAPADFMIAQMDYAGIDVAVLQNDHIYGSLNQYFADAMRAHPGRFIGLAQVEEARAHEDAQIERLRHAVTELGMRGLYYTTSTFFTTSYDPYYDEASFEPFWDEVRTLGLPVFWVFPSSSPKGDYLTELRRFLAWQRRYPEVPSVLVHGFPDRALMDDQGRLVLPGDIREGLRALPVYTEVLFPIKWGGRWDHPYPGAIELFGQYLDLFGPQRLMWGSDMPNVERYCTYRQSLRYLTGAAHGASEADVERILAHNVLALLGPARS